jgi:surfeit locus 1 family protein
VTETISAKRQNRPLRRMLTLVLLAVSLITLVSLGNWQVRRLAWKEALLSDIDQRLALAPIGIDKLGELLAAGGDIDYRPVNVTGQFDHAHEQHFFATFNGDSGYYIYTPMVLAGGQILFVNRGFVPYDKKEAKSRMAGEVSGIVTVTGLARARLSEKPGWFVPENDLAKNIFYWKDLDAMTARAGFARSRVLQYFVDANAAPNPGGLPIGGVTQLDFANNHLQYAVTWYGLAAALAAIAAISWWRERGK